MKGKWISVMLAVVLAALAFGALPAPRAFAAGSITYYPANVAKDAVFSGTSLTSGTPFAVYVTITGATANASCTGPKLRLMDAATGTTADSNFRTWAGTGGWLTDTGAWASFPSITTDASGNWSGWAYGAIPSTATNTYLAARIRCGSSNVTTATPYPALILMDMSTTGGWLTETIGSARAGRAFVVKNVDSTIVGMYVSEDNGITEGYPATVGYSKVAVPNCTTCGYTIESWDLTAPGTAVGQINTMGAGSCPNTVTAGGTTSLDACYVPTAISLRALSAQAPLQPLAAIPVAGLVLAGGLVAWRRRKA
jgi:hypothetical protein